MTMIRAEQGGESGPRARKTPASSASCRATSAALRWVLSFNSRFMVRTKARWKVVSKQLLLTEVEASRVKSSGGRHWTCTVPQVGSFYPDIMSSEAYKSL